MKIINLQKFKLREVIMLIIFRISLRKKTNCSLKPNQIHFTSIKPKNNNWMISKKSTKLKKTA